MTPHDLIAAFDAVAEAPDGVIRLRELVLQLAVRGRLVPQGPADESASRLLEQLRVGRKRLIADKVINEPRHPVGVPVADEPYELPSAWEWVRLGDAAAIVGGGTPKSSEPSYWPDGNDVPWLTPADMRHQPARYITRGKRDITKAGLASSGAQLLPKGSVLFSSRAPIGHVGIAASALSTNQGFKSCVPYVAAMSEYLYVFLRKVGPEVDAAATGTTFKEVTGKDVALIPLPIPPLAEQRRIVARVDELMGLLDRLEAARTTRDATRAAVRDSTLDALREADTPAEVEVAWNRFAERMDDLLCDPADIAPLRQAVLQLAVRGRLVRQDPADEPAEALCARTAAEQARLVTAGHWRGPSELPAPEQDEAWFAEPAGWTWMRLGSACRFIDYRGNTPPKTQAGVRLITAKNIRRAFIQRQPEQFVSPGTYESWMQRGFPERGDVLFTMEAPLGNAAEIDFDEPFALAQRAIILHPLAGIVGRYVMHALLSPMGAAAIEAKASGTTARGIKAARLRLIPFPFPPIPEQRRIVARVDELMGLIDRLEARLTAARTAHAAFAAAAVHHLDA